MSANDSPKYTWEKTPDGAGFIIPCAVLETPRISPTLRTIFSRIAQQCGHALRQMCTRGVRACSAWFARWRQRHVNKKAHAWRCAIRAAALVGIYLPRVVVAEQAHYRCPATLTVPSQRGPQLLLLSNAKRPTVAVPSPELATFLLLAAAHRARFISGTGLALFERLRPRRPDGQLVMLPAASANGPAYGFNPDTADYDGREVDTTIPAPSTTIAFTPTGVPATDLTTLNALLVSLTSGVGKITGNTRLTIPAGTQFAGRMVIPAGLVFGVDSRLEICTASFASLPAMSPGNGSTKSSYLNAVNATYAALMPELYPTSNNAFGLVCADSAANVTFRGFNFTNRNLTQQQVALLSVAPLHYTDGVGHEPYNEPDIAKYPKSIHFVQCLLDGGVNNDATRAIRGLMYTGEGIAWVDGYQRNVCATGNEGQHFFAPGYANYCDFFNNDCEIGGAGESSMHGGLPLPGDNPALLPRNIAYVQNVFRAVPGEAVKNTGEVKYGYNILYANNKHIGADNANGGHSGALEIKLTDQLGPGVNADTHDVTVVNSFFASGVAAVYPSGREFAPNNTNKTRFIFIANNLMLPSVTVREGAGLIVGGNDLHDVVMIFNTSRTTPTKAEAYALPFSLSAVGSLSNIDIRWNTLINSNVVGFPNWAIASEQAISGPTVGEPMFDSTCTGTSFLQENLLWNFVYPNANFVRQFGTDSIANLGLVDYATDKLWLLNTSLGYQAASGWDTGYQKSVFDVIQARVNPV